MAKKTKVATFPQADNLDLVINVLRHIGKNKASNALKVASSFGLTQRQGSYYISALSWLGLVSLDDDKMFRLTDAGRRLYYSNKNQKISYIFKYTMSNPVFAKVFTRKKVTKTDMRKAKMHKLSESTQKRRIATARAWNQRINAHRSKFKVAA